MNDKFCKMFYKKHNKGHKNVNIWDRVKQIMKGNQKYLCQQQQPWQKMNFILYKFLHNEIQSKCFPFIADDSLDDSLYAEGKLIISIF